MTRSNPLVKPSSSRPTIFVRNPDTVRAWIAHLHDTSGLTYREIAAKPYFSKPPSMPPGTICSIEKGEKFPKKYRHSRGIPDTVTVEPCPIHGKACTLNCATEKAVPIAARVVKPSKPRPNRPRRIEVYPDRDADQIAAKLRGAIEPGKLSAVVRELLEEAELEY